MDPDRRVVTSVDYRPRRGSADAVSCSLPGRTGEVERRQPGIDLHAFSPMGIINGVGGTGLSFAEFLTAVKEARLASVPGTAAEILDDVRWVLTEGKLPTALWIEIITTAHRVGLPTTATMLYGHVDTPAHWVADLHTLAVVQDAIGGFAEVVLLPFVHHSSPIPLAGVARPATARSEEGRPALPLSITPV
jgi:FO synthase